MPLYWTNIDTRNAVLSASVPVSAAIAGTLYAAKDRNVVNFLKVFFIGVNNQSNINIFRTIMLNPWRHPANISTWLQMLPLQHHLDTLPIWSTKLAEVNIKLYGKTQIIRIWLHWHNRCIVPLWDYCCGRTICGFFYT